MTSPGFHSLCPGESLRVYPGKATPSTTEPQPEGPAAAAAEAVRGGSKRVVIFLWESRGSVGCSAKVKNP